jgi:hypothetical protein
VGAAGGLQAVGTHKAVCRSDTDAVLGVIDPRPADRRPRADGRLVEALLERDDVVYETAGAHDGPAALEVIPTTVTIVCWNTWRLAERRAARAGTRFRFDAGGSAADVAAQIPPPATW